MWGGAELGAGFVLINPLHAAEPAAPMEPSPYLPTTRRFQNPLYLRVERIPEYADLDATARRAVATLRTKVHKQLDAIDRIDRDIAWDAKRRALRLVHAVPRTVGRELAYRGYRTREGQGLEDYATWCALFEAHGPDWHDWPAELQHPAILGGGGLPGRERRCRRLPPMAAVGAGRAAVRDPGGSDPGGHGARRHARPGGRRAPVRIGFLGAAGRFRPAA